MSLLIMKIIPTLTILLVSGLVAAQVYENIDPNYERHRADQYRWEAQEARSRDAHDAQATSKLQRDLDYCQGTVAGQHEIIDNLKIQIATLQETIADDKIVIQSLKESLEQCTGTPYDSIR